MVAETCHSLEDRGVHNRSFDPRGIRSRRVLPDQRQASVHAVEQEGGDKGEVPANKDVELDHGLKLCLWLEGVERRN